MKLSIIIPLYNNEKYIKQCIESCMRQGNVMPNSYEVIVINDGSTDNSKSVVEKLIPLYPNLIFFSQENCGLSVARNKGLQIASGDYVWFVDSDDFIKENCLQSLFKIMNDNLPQLIRFMSRNVSSDMRKEFKIRDNNIYSFEDSLIKGTDLLELPNFVVCATFYLLKRSFLNEFDFKFVPNLIHEDMEFSPKVYYHAEDVYLFKDVLYFVRQSENSITRTSFYKKSSDLIIVSQKLYEYFRNQNLQINKYSHLICRSLNSAFINMSLLSKEDYSSNIIHFTREIESHPHLLNMYKTDEKLKNKILFFILKIFSTKKVISVISLYNKIFK